MAWFDHQGGRIYFEQEGTGVPVLLLPGWGGRIEHLSFLRTALAPHFSVIAADIPGSGRSEPQPREYTLTYYEDDSRALLALLNHLGTTPAHLVGYSDGGEYALLMAAIEPAAVRSVITWGAVGQLPESTEMAAWFHNLIDDPIPSLSTFSKYLRNTYGESGARLMAQSVARVWREMILAGGDISRSQAAQLECPVRLILGDRDDFVPQSLAQGIADTIPHGDLVLVQGAEHGVHHSHTDWLVEMVLNWVTTH